MRILAIIALVALAAGNIATWAWARGDVSEALLHEWQSEASEYYRAHDFKEPLPRVGIVITRSWPILPGVLVVTYAPTTNGKAPCIDTDAIVLWYGVGAKTLFRTP